MSPNQEKDRASISQRSGEGKAGLLFVHSEVWAQYHGEGDGGAHGREPASRVGSVMEAV